MEIITGKKAVDETLPDETCHLVTWFHKIIRKGHNLKNTIDPTLDLDDQTFESISKVAELAAHCTANKYFQRPTMEHVVNVLGPFAQKWKPLRLEEIEENCLAGKKQEADDGDVNREDERLVFLFAMRNEKPVKEEAGDSP
nr:receptor-like kinase TMK4 [Ipomoea trifida]